MSSFHVGGKVVDKVDLCRKKHWAWPLDVWPFAILYATWLATIVPNVDFIDAMIGFGDLLASHILVLLFSMWSVDFKCFIQFSKVNHHSYACYLFTWVKGLWWPCVCVLIHRLTVSSRQMRLKSPQPSFLVLKKLCLFIFVAK